MCLLSQGWVPRLIFTFLGDLLFFRYTSAIKQVLSESSARWLFLEKKAGSYGGGTKHSFAMSL